MFGIIAQNFQQQQKHEIVGDTVMFPVNVSKLCVLSRQKKNTKYYFKRNGKTTFQTTR